LKISKDENQKKNTQFNPNAHVSVALKLRLQQAVFQ